MDGNSLIAEFKKRDYAKCIAKHCFETTFNPLHAIIFQNLNIFFQLSLPFYVIELIKYIN